MSFVEDEEKLRQLMQAKPELYCMMPEEQYRAVQAALGVTTRELAHVLLFPASLGELMGRSALRRVVLVTNRVSDKR